MYRLVAVNAEDDDPWCAFHFVCARGHFDAAEFRHRNVQDQQIRMLLLAQSYGFEAVGRFRDDGDTGGFEQSAQSSPDDAVIVSQQDAQGVPPRTEAFDIPPGLSIL